MKFEILRKSTAALCLAVALIAAPRAHAVMVPTDQLLGTVVPGTPADPANETEMVRFLVDALNSGSYSAVSYPGAGVDLGDNVNDPNPETYTLWKPNGLNVPAPLPTTTGVQTVTSDTTVDLGTMQYDYILAKFGSDSEALWIGNLTGEITLPNLTGNTNGLSGYTLVNPHTSSVPDGGTTVALLGIALVGVEGMRRSVGGGTKV